MSNLKAVLDRINKRLEILGLSATAASEKAGLSKDAIRNIYRGIETNKRFGLSTSTLQALADVLNTTPEWLMKGEGREVLNVPVVGRIGVGALLNAMKEPYETVDAPPESSEETVAIEVIGDSLLPKYEHGTVLYFSKRIPPEKKVNRLCVVHLEDGRTFVRTLRTGTEPGTWCLQALNPNESDIDGVRVAWAAKIEWTKPA
jgi:SOS-response transcriptional repressor LexA